LLRVIGAVPGTMGSKGPLDRAQLDRAQLGRAQLGRAWRGVAWRGIKKRHPSPITLLILVLTRRRFPASFGSSGEYQHAAVGIPK
jgi:hypothetical protein